MFGSIARLAGGAARTLFSTARKTTGAALSIPGVRKAVNATGIGAAALSVGSALIPQGSRGLPALPGMPGGMPPGFPGMASAGQRSIFKDDPNVVDALKPYAIPMRGLRTYYRAPRGFVVMRDSVGDAYGIPKTIAKQYLGWKPAKKPLLSIRDTNAIKHAGTAIQKLQNAEKMAKKIANWKTPVRRERIIVEPRQLKLSRKAA